MTRGVIGLGFIAVVTFALIWLVAVPMAAVCPAVAPRGELHPCSAQVRHSAGISWSLVVTAATAVGVVALVLGGADYASSAGSPWSDWWWCA